MDIRVRFIHMRHVYGKTRWMDRNFAALGYNGSGPCVCTRELLSLFFYFFGRWIFPVLFMSIYFLGVLLFLYSGLVSMSLYFALHGVCRKSLLRFLFYIFLR